MRKLATFAVLFALAFGFAAGLTVVDVNAGNIFCAQIEDTYVCTSQTGPLCTDPANPYYYIHCAGRYMPGGGLCDCHWVGCCATPDP